MEVDLDTVVANAKLAWAASPTVRAEFGHNEASYLAYVRAKARGAVGQRTKSTALGAGYVDHDAVASDAKRAWASSAMVRQEFSGNEDAYLAYMHAEARGAVRVFRKPGSSSGQLSSPGAQHLTLDAPAQYGVGAPLHVTLNGPARGHIRGYGAVFGGRNRRGFSIKPGAFRNALRTPLVMLWQHQSDKPIGSWTRLVEDDFGLLAEGQVNLELLAGRNAFALLEASDVTGLSIGFNVQPQHLLEVDGVAEVAELDLLEISIAAVPAEDRARITKVGA